MSLIVDASVALKWLLDEERSDAARALLPEPSLAAPDLILLEAYNAVWKRWRRGETMIAQLKGVASSLRGAIDELVSSEEFTDAAGQLAIEHRLPIYDCVCLALASRSGMTLVTADERQFEAARQARIDARLL